MDGFRSSLKPMFKREGEEINGWIHKHSQAHVQERRRGDKWIMDGFTSTYKPMFRGEREKINGWIQKHS
jgi:hypothetical protein